MGKDLTTNEVAEILKADKQAVRRWCKEGRFPSAYQLPIKSGNGQIWLIPEKDLKGFEPPDIGRKQSNNPSKAALAKRAQRERDKQDSKS